MLLFRRLHEWRNRSLQILQPERRRAPTQNLPGGRKGLGSWGVRGGETGDSEAVVTLVLSSASGEGRCLFGSFNNTVVQIL